MRFLSKQEFIGDMPEQYAKTIRKLRPILSAKKRLLLQRILERASDSEIAELEREIEILDDMLDDMIRAKRTVENYYEPGGRWDDAYCNLARIGGKNRVELGCDDEGLVAGDFEAFGRY